MLPPGLQSSHSWQWLIQKKKNSEPFPGILEWGAAFWPTTWLLNGGNFCRVRITVTSSNILDVTKPQTNNESVCARVKCSLTLSTCLSNELALQQNVRQDRKFQAQRDLQCLCKMHRCMELWSIECVRDKVRDTDSDYVMRKPSRCWLGAVPRYWKVVASCFRFISFAENTSAALAPRAGISQPILLLFFLFSCS